MMDAGLILQFWLSIEYVYWMIESRFLSQLDRFGELLFRGTSSSLDLTCFLIEKLYQ